MSDAPMEQAPLFADFGDPDALGSQEERAILGIRAGRDVTGSRLSAEKRAAIVALAAQGFGVKRIAAALGVSDHTVTLAVRRSQEDVATLKTELAGDFARDADEIRRSYMDDLRAGKVKPDSKWVSAATFADKSLVMAGDATAIVEHRHTGPSIAELAAAREALPAATVIECQDEYEGAPDADAPVAKQVTEDAP